MKLPQVAFFAAAVAAGILSPSARLAAQDVTVTPHRLFDENVADTPPTIKGKWRPAYPDEMRKTTEGGYVLVALYVDAEGKSHTYHPIGTHRAFTTAVVTTDRPDLRPATKEGKPVASAVWFATIFNPSAAKGGKADAAPRILDVSPVTTSEKALAKLKMKPGLVRGILEIDATGAPGRFTLDDDSKNAAPLLDTIQAGFARWKFAPARAGGQPVAGTIHTAIALTPPPEFAVSSNSTPPQIVERQRPEYPEQMLRSGLRGEVTVQFMIDERGRPTDPVVLQSNNPGFDAAAITAVLAWKFKPATRDGKPVKARSQAPIIFQLDGGGGTDAFSVREKSKSAQKKLPEHLRVDTPPKPLGVVIPVYPYALLRDGKDGKAEAGILVGESGRVSSVTILAASDPEFGLALAAAIEAFQFEPAIKEGKAVRSALSMKQAFEPYDAPPMATEEDRKLIRLEKKAGGVAPAGELDAVPRALSRRSPAYPLALSGQGEPAEATVEFLIDEEGFARLPRIASATHPEAGYAAVQAVAQWRFEAPKKGGKTVVTRMRAPFNFPATKRAATAAGAAETGAK